MRPRRVRTGLLALAVLALCAAGCGKKGPPLPPLNLLPAAPGDVTAVRRGPRVDLTFRVPNANTDRSTPADIARVEVYAWTVPGPVAGDEVVRRGTRVGSVTVNKPKDEDQPPDKVPPPPPGTVEQNAVATISDTLPADADPAAYRAYVIVGVNKRGRRGALSTRVAVPLVPPPAAPGQPQIKYDEKAITVSWPPVAAPEGVTLGYNVYRPADGTLLTPQPLDRPTFEDTAIVWEQERCYEVRSVETSERVRIESDASASRCVTLHDTFAPARPEGLVGVASEGAISLIWTANREPDLAGYLVLRAIAPSTDLAPITPSPMTDTNYRDQVPAGLRVTYAIQAVDKAGNRSEPSAPITETAR